MAPLGATPSDIARLPALPELQGEIRCDFHPRWDRTGQQLCIDSVHEGFRGIYLLDVRAVLDSEAPLARAGAAPG